MLRRTERPFLLGPMDRDREKYIRDKPLRGASTRGRGRFPFNQNSWFEVLEISSDERNSIFRNFQKIGQPFEVTYTKMFGISLPGVSVPFNFPLFDLLFGNSIMYGMSGNFPQKFPYQETFFPRSKLSEFFG